MKSCGLCCTKIEHFGVSLGHNEILHDVNLHVHCGELTTLIGPNGAGKSTLLKAILGEIAHTGELKFLDAKGKHTGHPVIGYVPQRLDFDFGTPVSVLDLFASCLSLIPVWLSRSHTVKQKTRDSLKKVQAEHLIDRRLGNLSGGELQRVLLALALQPEPDLLLLDEPVSGVDQKGLAIFYEMVSQLRNHYDLSVILVSHDLGLIPQYTDRMVFLNKTVQCSGKPQEVLSNPTVAQALGISWMNQPAHCNAEKTEGLV